MFDAVDVHMQGGMPDCLAMKCDFINHMPMPDASSACWHVHFATGFHRGWNH